MSIKKVIKSNLRILLNLAQAYEAEFSPITKKMPSKNGLYQLDTIPDKNHPAFLLYDGKFPVGFCIKGTDSLRHDIAEFYIVPTHRGHGIGQSFAISIFKKYRGSWQVRQIKGATKAKRFWRKTIRAFVGDKFEESVVRDEYWGPVTRQTFEFR